MSHPAPVKPTHKAIQTYYQTLQAYREHHVGHETALRSAFQNLLAETAKAHHWLLVPEQSTRTGGKRVVPDGTLCDDFWNRPSADDSHPFSCRTGNPTLFLVESIQSYRSGILIPQG